MVWNSYFNIFNGLLIQFQIKLYHAVIDDVIAGVRDSFLDEGVDEQVLQEMKHIWTTKLMASKAVEVNIEPVEAQPPAVVANNPPKSKVNFNQQLSNEIIKLNKIDSIFLQSNGTKSKKPAQRERKNSGEFFILHIWIKNLDDDLFMFF